MTANRATSSSPPLPIGWSTAVAMIAVGAILMLALGWVLIPLGRVALQVAYGILEIAVLNPWGISLPPPAAFVFANLTLVVTALAASRRAGALLAIQSVERQLGRADLTYGIAAIAGLIGAAGFVVAVPWPALDPAAPPLFTTGHVLLGYVLYVLVLAVGPLRGASLYFEAHPRCPTCWVWLQRETGGGSFTEDDQGLLRTALAANDFDALRALPVADPATTSLSLRWWECPVCHQNAQLTCVPESNSRFGAPIFVGRLSAQRIRDLRALIDDRRALRDRSHRATVAQPSGQP